MTFSVLTSITATQMMTTQQLMQYGNFIANGVTSKLIGAVMYLLPIIAYFILFETKNVEGWKAIIPFYNTYLQYKLFFKAGKFWRLMLMTVLFAVSFAVIFVGVVLAEGKDPVPDNAGITLMVGFALMLISLIWLIVICIQYDISICKHYNMGLLFTLGMIFFTPVFLIILAYEVKIGRAKAIE